MEYSLPGQSKAGKHVGLWPPALPPIGPWMHSCPSFTQNGPCQAVRTLSASPIGRETGTKKPGTSPGFWPASDRNYPMVASTLSLPPWLSVQASFRVSPLLPANWNWKNGFREMVTPQ